MIGETQSATAMRNWARHFERVLLMEAPAWQLLIIAAVVGALWAASLFDWSFIAGRHLVWPFIEGGAKGWQLDMGQHLQGYLYYVQGPWDLPLFYVPALRAPPGTNVLFLDVVPIVALVGKLVHTFTGVTINLYGAYIFLCYVLPGVMMALVLIAAKVRYALAAIIAAIFANSMPALLMRWGIPHAGQFLLIGALAFYLFFLKERGWRGLAAVWIGWLVLAFLTNMYLFVMVGTIWVCAIIQRRLNGLATTRQALKTGALTVALVTTVMAVSGQFGGGGELPFSLDYGNSSMNLLSPIAPQLSGLFPGLGGVIDATGGQFEGFNYLGLGLLLASLLMLPAEAGWLRQNLRRHIVLLTAFAALTAFAISNRVFVGHRLLFELPLPLYIKAALGIFRSSGRFFWPIAYAQLAIVTVLGFRRAQPLVILCFIIAVVLQLLDVQPLRANIIDTIAAQPASDELDRGKIARFLARARYLEIVPSFQCLLYTEPFEAKIEGAAMDLMLQAATMNVPTNSVYAARERFGLTLSDVLRAPSRALQMRDARRVDYCNQEIEYARSGGHSGDLIVLLTDRPRQEEMAPGVICSPLSSVRYCQRKG